MTRAPRKSCKKQGGSFPCRTTTFRNTKSSSKPAIKRGNTIPHTLQYTQCTHLLKIFRFKRNFYWRKIQTTTIKLIQVSRFFPAKKYQLKKCFKKYIVLHSGSEKPNPAKLSSMSGSAPGTPHGRSLRWTGTQPCPVRWRWSDGPSTGTGQCWCEVLVLCCPLQACLAHLQHRRQKINMTNDGQQFLG